MGLAKDFADLFSGLERAHGVSKPLGRTSERGKAEHKYVTKHEPVTPEAWERHLAGEEGLVITPIRDDGTVVFGAVDVDVYPLDLALLAGHVKELSLPLTVCRTKSGGAHLYLFLSEPAPAELVQKRLTDWAVALGHPRVEVFPKQVRLASTNDCGSGINVPYFGPQSTRYAVGTDGKAITAEEFIKVARKRRVVAERLPSVVAPVADGLEEAPPCLQHWARAGVAEGQRNEVMFDFAVYAKKKWPDAWRERFEDMNRRFCNPPLPAGEVVAILGSVGKQKEYLYKAKCEGPYCNPRLCRQREHGRGGGFDDPGVTVDQLTVVLTEPRTFIVAVNGRRIEMESATLLDQRKFRHAVFENLVLQMAPLKPKAWQRLLDKLVADKEMIEAPEDAAPRGQLRLHLREFFDRHAGAAREELLIERCWTDDLSGRTYFRSKDFATYLKRHRVQGFREKDIYSMVRGIGGGSELVSAGSAKVRCWWVPAEAAPSEALPTPEVRGGTEAPF